MYDQYENHGSIFTGGHGVEAVDAHIKLNVAPLLEQAVALENEKVSIQNAVHNAYLGKHCPAVKHKAFLVNPRFAKIPQVAKQCYKIDEHSCVAVGTLWSQLEGSVGQYMPEILKVVEGTATYQEYQTVRCFLIAHDLYQTKPPVLLPEKEIYRKLAPVLESLLGPNLYTRDATYSIYYMRALTAIGTFDGSVENSIEAFFKMRDKLRHCALHHMPDETFFSGKPSLLKDKVCHCDGLAL